MYINFNDGLQNLSRLVPSKSHRLFDSSLVRFAFETKKFFRIPHLQILSQLIPKSTNRLEAPVSTVSTVAVFIPISFGISSFDISHVIVTNWHRHRLPRISLLNWHRHQLGYLCLVRYVTSSWLTSLVFDKLRSFTFGPQPDLFPTSIACILHL